MRMSTTKMTVLFGGVTMLVLIGCVTALAWHGTLDGQAAIGFFSGLSLAGITGLAGHVGVQAGTKAVTDRDAAVARASRESD